MFQHLTCSLALMVTTKTTTGPMPSTSDIIKIIAPVSNATKGTFLYLKGKGMNFIFQSKHTDYVVIILHKNYKIPIFRFHRIQPRKDKLLWSGIIFAFFTINETACIAATFIGIL